MFEEAYEIFDFLPINKTVPEDSYIRHLLDVFNALDASETSARLFIVMPIHLLFMLALQYKVLRIARAYPKSLDLFFAGVGNRNKKDLLDVRRSVFSIALINERTMPEIFRRIDVEEVEILKIKRLVSDRNDRMAHAKGGIESDPEGRVEQYLEVLRNMQHKFLNLNDKVAEKWLKEMGKGREGIEYMETRFIEEYLCPADLKDGKLADLEKQLNGEI